MITHLAEVMAYFFSLRPVAPLPLWSYIALVGIIAITWIVHLYVEAWSIKNGSILFANMIKELILPETIDILNIYVYALILSYTAHSLLLRWPFIASMTMLIHYWLILATCIIAARQAWTLWKSRQRRKRLRRCYDIENKGEI